MTLNDASQFVYEGVTVIEKFINKGLSALFPNLFSISGAFIAFLGLNLLMMQWNMPTVQRRGPVIAIVAGSLMIAFNFYVLPVIFSNGHTGEPCMCGTEQF